MNEQCIEINRISQIGSHTLGEQLMDFFGFLTARC